MIGAIAGDIQNKVRELLTPDLLGIAERFCKKYIQ